MILITTKRGHAGKTSVSYSGNVRYSGPARLPDLMNSWDFANYFNEANANAGQAAVFNDETLGRIQAFIAGEIPLYEGVDGKFRPQTTIANGNSWHFHQQANDNVDGTRSALEYAAGYPAGSTEAWQYMRRDNHLTASLYSDYTLNLKGHNMNVMAGINIEDYNDRYMGISRPDFITVNVPEIGAATGEDKIEYASMFNVTDLSSSTEVLLWRQYSNSSSNNSTHYTVDYLQRNGSGNIWRSPILENGELGCPTGYSVRKGLNTSADMHPTMPSTTASVVFRAAEAYLNYIEAYYERFGNLGGNWTSSTGHR